MDAIVVSHLTKMFSNLIAIDDLSLKIEKGKITGLIGADGAGKTTLIRLIVGMLAPKNGKISVIKLNQEMKIIIYLSKPKIVGFDGKLGLFFKISTAIRKFDSASENLLVHNKILPNMLYALASSCLLIG